LAFYIFTDESVNKRTRENLSHLVKLCARVSWFFSSRVASLGMLIPGKLHSRVEKCNSPGLERDSRFRLSTYLLLTLQCFDAVGWAAGRASGL